MKHSKILLIGILLMGLGLRCINLQSRGIIYDDAFSFFLSIQNLPAIIQGTAADTMPPLYYFLLHFWMALSQSLWWLRLLSVLINLASVAICILAGEIAAGRIRRFGCCLHCRHFAIPDLSFPGPAHVCLAGIMPGRLCFFLQPHLETIPGIKRNGMSPGWMTPGQSDERKLARNHRPGLGWGWSFLGRWRCTRITWLFSCWSCLTFSCLFAGNGSYWAGSWLPRG